MSPAEHSRGLKGPCLALGNPVLKQVCTYHFSGDNFHLILNSLILYAVSKVKCILIPRIQSYSEVEFVCDAQSFGFSFSIKRLFFTSMMETWGERGKFMESYKTQDLSCSYCDYCKLNVKPVHQYKFILHNRLLQSSKFPSAAVWPRKDAHIGSVELHFTKYIKSTERHTLPDPGGIWCDSKTWRRWNIMQGYCWWTPSPVSLYTYTFGLFTCWWESKCHLCII